MVEYNGSLPSLTVNPYSWTKVSSIIFLDSPAGTGFSYSRTSRGSRTADTKFACQGYDFVRKWLLSHPNFIANPLYIAGDSYSGKIVPIIVQKMSDGIEAGDSPLLNLKGYSIGNPGTDPKFDDNSRVPFAHRMAIIPDELYKKAKRSCKGEYRVIDSRNIQCANDLRAIAKCTKRINRPHILEPKCYTDFRPLNKMDENRRYLMEIYGESYMSLPKYPRFGCRNYNKFLCHIWANDIRVQKALHIRKGTVKVWIRCKIDLPYKKDVESAVSFHYYLNIKGYRALIYRFDHIFSLPSTHSICKQPKTLKRNK
ncbi:hypothetical protein CIPAW_01G003000 [Carya illinoinensis]|uniref:Serine carboxypeptidase-like 18 n=1 Tax=Carya illinoinensis TaxID=32201 RepID=A0A8T1REW2_CARIL|nr:hypothetical protein CIPAW_01G003000 [Carya illinoinensis]